MTTAVVHARRLRSCLGRFATGVTVVSCDADAGPHGVTVNSFTAVSLNPALVLVSLRRESKACRYLADRPFTINVLHAWQAGHARHFAGETTRVVPRWERPREDLACRLVGALATIACSPWSHHEAGDHVLFLGKVEEFDQHAGDPLVFYQGTFRRLERS